MRRQPFLGCMQVAGAPPSAASLLRPLEGDCSQCEARGEAPRGEVQHCFTCTTCGSRSLDSENVWLACCRDASGPDELCAVCTEPIEDEEGPAVAFAGCEHALCTDCFVSQTTFAVGNDGGDSTVGLDERTGFWSPPCRICGPSSFIAEFHVYKLCGKPM